MRTPLIAANWKMHKTADEAVQFGEELASRMQSLEDASAVEVAIAAPFTALWALRDVLAHSPIALAAQNVHFEAEGAFTGEISAGMLRDAGCRYVVVGHSERRTLFAEASEIVARKARAALQAGLAPIVCLGESLPERESGRTLDVLGAQIRLSLDGVEADRAEQLVVAYEPIWAIGTGHTATPEMAQEVHAFLRERLIKRFGEPARGIRILYGGSIKPDSIRGLMAQPDIDGGLVGGASLDPASFFAIIRFE